MDKEVKQKWIAALRSGKYQQGMLGSLRTANNKFCCLGVLCDIQYDNLWYLNPNYGNYEILGRYAFLPPELREKLNITVTEERQLSKMNDCNRLSFPQIADWIEENM